MLTALALIPGILIIIYIFRMDRMEHEPIPLLIRLIILGAVSCAPAAFLETQIDPFLQGHAEGTLMNAIMVAFFSAGLMEEVCKFLFLKIGSWRSREFNCTFDGVVYGVSVAIGFACLENVMYVLDGGLQVALMRAVLSVPLHAFCGAFMGAFYGRAKKAAIEGNRGKATSLQIQGVIIPIIVHGLYDTFAMWNNDLGFYLLIGFVIVMYIVGLRVINVLAREDEWMVGGPESAETVFVQSYATPEMERVRGTNGLSIASLVFGVISFLSMAMFVIPSLLAIGLGIAGNKKSGPDVKDNCAKAGMIMGAISLALNIFLIFGMMGAQQ